VGRKGDLLPGVGGVGRKRGGKILPFLLHRKKGKNEISKDYSPHMEWGMWVGRTGGVEKQKSTISVNYKRGEGGKQLSRISKWKGEGEGRERTWRKEGERKGATEGLAFLKSACEQGREKREKKKRRSIQRVEIPGNGKNSRTKKEGRKRKKTPPFPPCAKKKGGRNVPGSTIREVREEQRNGIGEEA